MYLNNNIYTLVI